MIDLILVRSKKRRSNIALSKPLSRPLDMSISFADRITSILFKIEFAASEIASDLCAEAEEARVVATSLAREPKSCI